MRTRWKVLSSILSAVMVLSSLSAIVLADDYKQANGFKYRLVGDELDVICQSHSVILSRAADITSETEISKIVLDVSDVEYQKDNFHSLYCSGVGDIASDTDDVFADVSVLDIVCDEETSFTYIELDGFPGVDSDGLSISEKIMVGDLSLRKFGVDSLDFLDGLRLIERHLQIFSSLVHDDTGTFALIVGDSHLHLCSTGKLQHQFHTTHLFGSQRCDGDTRPSLGHGERIG